MYGLVNKSLEDLMRKEHGDAAWDAVRKRAGVDAAAFLTMEGYPDSMTYALVGAASDLTGIPAAELLRRFGRHWVLQTAPAAYGPIMDAAGASLAEFLENLPNLHSRITLVFKHLKPPIFTVERLGEGRYALGYSSTRQGLTPFVVGLLEGLAQRFGEDAEVRTAGAAKADGVVHFEVRWTARSSAA